MIDALFIDPEGPYPKLLGADRCWDEKRDARTYNERGPVVAHPPCQRWTNFAAANWGRYHRVLPAWYPGGTDEGCFYAALRAILHCGGVLEHPAYTHAWEAYELPKPERCRKGWQAYTWGGTIVWVCEVWQSAYGHRAQKKTWLLYHGKSAPCELDWRKLKGTHQVGFQDKRGKARNKPTLPKREANATPESFAMALIRIAARSNGPRSEALALL